MDGPLRPAREIIRSKVSRRSARLPMELGLTSATLLATTPLELAPRGREPRVALEGNPGLARLGGFVGCRQRKVLKIKLAA